MTSAIGAYGSLGYSYDPIGNRLTKTEAGVSEAYSYVLNTHRLEEILGTTTDSRHYDAAGNTISSLLGSYTYDDQNRMVGFTKTGTAASYGYNGKGERVRKTVNGTITRFRYSPSGALLGEYDQTGQAIREYVYLEGQPVAQWQGSAPAQVAYLHTDHLGAVVKATDGAGGVVWDSDRKPFGERVETVAQVEMPLGFPGQYYDQESNNYYNYFRDYDPSTGRYLQSDPIGLKGGISTYGYALQNPLKYFDIDGLEVRIICRPLAGMLSFTGKQHCFVHVTCPDEGWASTYSLFSTGTNSFGYPNQGAKAENDPRDNPNSPNNTSNTRVDINSCPTEKCGFEKAVRDRFKSFPSGDVPYNPFGPNSNSFAFDLATGTLLGGQPGPGIPGSNAAPGIDMPHPNFP